MKLTANVSLWLNCNLRCTYCFANPIQPPKEWSKEIEQNLASMEDFLNKTGHWSLDFSGGEPLIYPGFKDFCIRLAKHGHEVMFYTNGTIRLSEIFNKEEVKSLSRVTFSYHPIHEKNAKLDKLFDENITYLQESGVDTAVNYVLYPNRESDNKKIKERFLKLKTDFQFRVFQGEFEDKLYPFDHSEDEKSSFAEIADLRSRFMMENGYYIPTYKACEAGRSLFYISMRTGGVYLCEQLQQTNIVNFYQKDSANSFLEKRQTKPIMCPAKRCSCRLTIEQYKFLEQHDPWDLSVYPEWEKISLPKEKALQHWEGLEKAFVEELKQRLVGNKIFLWGGGVHALVLLRQLKRWSFPMESIIAILDSNPLRQGRKILNIPIISKEKFINNYNRDCSDMIISSRAFETEIINEISLTFDKSFNVIPLYDGNMKNHFESIETTE